MATPAEEHNASYGYKREKNAARAQSVSKKAAKQQPRAVVVEGERVLAREPPKTLSHACMCGRENKVFLDDTHCNTGSE
jgi:hypothetical protein